MWVASASSPPTAASPTEAQNSHQMGPKIRARPPTRNATMMMDTATHDTGRPWCDTVAGPPVLTWLSWPPSAETPATAPEPSWSAIPLLLSGCGSSVEPYCGGASLAARTGPVSAGPFGHRGGSGGSLPRADAAATGCVRGRLRSRLGFAGGLAYDYWEDG